MWLRGLPPALLVLALALAPVSAATMIGCQSQEPEGGATETPPEPQILSLAPSDPTAAGVGELVLSWEPISGIDRFVLCETVPPQGTECEDLLGVSETPVSVPGPSSDPQAAGTWIKYLWLQSCGERECSKPPTPAGAIARRAVDGDNARSFVVVVRRLKRDQLQVRLANAATETGAGTSTLVARTPEGSELARCENVAPGDWCGPFQTVLLTNEIVVEQTDGGADASVQFAVMPSSTGPQPTPRSTP